MRTELTVDTQSLQNIDDFVGTQNLASDFYQRLIEYIQAFDDTLTDEFSVGMKLVSFDQIITFSVTDLGFYNPSLICFYGKLEDESPVQLIQHISQINFLLMAIKRPDPEMPKQSIGFLNHHE